MNTIYDISGKRGTVICFHGSNKDGGADVWGKPGNDHNGFVKEMLSKGFSYVCPPSLEGRWNTEDSTQNVDIVAINAIMSKLQAPAPYFLIGHSNGGGMVTRYAMFGAIRPILAVQFSNTDGVGYLYDDPAYTYPSLFCYSPEDPVADYDAIKKSMGVLESKGVRVIAKNLHTYYQKHQDEYDNEHKFVNTAPFTTKKFYEVLSLR